MAHRIRGRTRKFRGVTSCTHSCHTVVIHCSSWCHLISAEHGVKWRNSTPIPRNNMLSGFVCGYPLPMVLRCWKSEADCPSCTVVPLTFAACSLPSILKAPPRILHSCYTYKLLDRSGEIEQAWVLLSALRGSPGTKMDLRGAARYR